MVNPLQGLLTTFIICHQQLASTEPAMRGRVMAILLAILMGATPLGAPLVGWVADTFGPRWALGAGRGSGFRFCIGHRRTTLPAA